MHKCVKFKKKHRVYNIPSSRTEIKARLSIYKTAPYHDELWDGDYKKFRDDKEYIRLKLNEK